MKPVVLFLSLLAMHASAQTITTIAGTGVAAFGGDGGPATAAQLYSPIGICINHGQHMFIADNGNHRVRTIDPGNIISTLAGTGASTSTGDGGPATAASFIHTHGIATDSSEYVYVTDYVGCRIRKFMPGGSITTIAGTGTCAYAGDGGPATAAAIYSPAGITIDKRQNIYFSDRGNARIRKVDRYGTITTIAGDGTVASTGDGGPSTAARVGAVSMLATDADDNLFFTDMVYNRIRRIDTFGAITTIAGTGTAGFSGDWGPAVSAMLSYPDGLTIDGCGNIYFSDVSNYRVRRINIAGIISTIAGTGMTGHTGDGGSALLARVSPSKGMSTDKYGNVYLTTNASSYIRKITVVSNAPVFTGGATQAIVTCMDSVRNIDTVMEVRDLDTLQQLRWTVISIPLHGVVVAGYSAISTGAAIRPAGLTYLPTAGYTGTDSFKVQVGDCGSLADTTTIRVTVMPCGGWLSVSDAADAGLHVYPNPATTMLTITSAEAMGTIALYNMVGEMVGNYESSAVKMQLNIAHLPAGVYLVKAGGRVVSRFVKM